MTTVEKIEDLNQIGQEEFYNVVKMLYNSFLINRKYSSSSYVIKKEKLIDSFSLFLEQYLELQFVSSKQSKLDLINFIDKLNMQKELLEIASGEANMNDIKIAAQRLGKKSQSAFEMK
ncbi:MAG: hypothetical protein JSU01_20955 [Bacteroidetes bacterium]|nr:hypothetical protein [Bacteroidota bacterium]